MGVLNEMNQLEDEHEKYLDSLRESRLGHSGARGLGSLDNEHGVC